MKTTVFALAAMLVAGVASAATSVNVTETPAGTFTLDVTTDAIFDTIVVAASGDVGNEVDVTPGFFFDAGVILSPPGSGFSYATGFGDIELTYFATSNWTAGFSGQDFLQVDLFSGVGDATVYLLDNGPVIESASVSFGSAPVIPEPASLLIFAGLAGVVGMRRVR